MSSTHSFCYEQVERERLLVWVGNERPNTDEQQNAKGIKNQRILAGEDLLTLSKKAIEAAASNIKPAKLQKSENADQLDENSTAELKVRVLEVLLHVLTGKKVRIKIFNPDDLSLSNKAQEITSRLESTDQGQSMQGWGVEYDYYKMQKESETMTFNVEGVIRVSNMQDVKFSLTLNMSREFISEENINIRMGDAVKKDPLVINLDGQPAELTIAKFDFDLDSDGVSEKVPFVKPGSGFLALDGNKDGQINNGSELFGPSTGNGFSELSTYDEDGNMWIDESDTIFNDLLIWSKDSGGNDSLFSLGEKGVGAIYLGNISTQFSINDVSNNQQGEIRSTGIYLNNDATSVGTVHQIDLII